MFLWFALILALVVLIHESAHRLVFKRQEFEPHYRNRFRILNTVLEWESIKPFKPIKNRTLNFWKFPSSATRVSRFKVAFVGAAAGFASAFVIFTVLAAINLPVVFDNQYSIDEQRTITRDDLKVVRIDSELEDSGIQLGDELMTIGTENARNSDHYKELEKHFAGRSAVLQTSSASINAAVSPDSESGVAVADIETNRYGIGYAPIVGFMTTAQLTWFSVSSLWGGADTDVGEGVFILQTAQYHGFYYLAYLFGLVSILYSLVNLIPLPPFDLGRLLFKNKLPKPKSLKKKSR